jgi:hypothetical protein
MTMKGMDSIGDSLRALLEERPIVARCELLTRTYDFVRKADLSPGERKELERLVGRHLPTGIFSNVLSGSPIFFDLPMLDTYTVLNGRIFHFIHTQRYSREDFDDAYRLFINSLPELRSLLRQNMVDLLADFMAEGGYRLAEGGPLGLRLRFNAPGRDAECSVCTSIRSLDLQGLQRESVLLVPSAESLDPFVQFFREKGQAAEDAGIHIWVANMEQGTIDPFIGFTTDMDIYNQFKNPRLAEILRCTWRR